MKILCVTPTYWPAYEFGGPIQSLHLLNKGLKINGVDLTVYTTNKGQSSDIIVNQLVNVDDINTTYYSYYKCLDILGTTGWHFSLPMTYELRKNIKKFNLVYILSVWNFTSAITAYYCHKCNIPYIISPRGQLYKNVTNVKSWKKTPYFKFIVSNILKNAFAIHYTSEDEYLDVHERLKLKNKYIIKPNGIQLSDFKELPKIGEFIKKYPHLEDKDILLFLGRLSWKKGIDLVIKALPKIIKNNKNIHFVIAGNDEDNYKNELLKLIKKLKLNYCDLSNSFLENNNINKAIITFTGYLDDLNKKKAFVDSKVFILTSHSENFGMSVVEAMECGLPVIVSKNVGISNEIIKNKAGIVVNNTFDDITESINKLIGDNELRKEVKQNSKLFVRNNFDISKISTSMSQIFNELISK